MEAGFASHRGVDQRADDRSVARRSVDVSSAELGVIGRCDVVESGAHGHLRVVEYKAAPLRRRPVVTDAQQVQLALQGMCLSERGHTVIGYAVFFTNHRTTVEVDVDGELRRLAVDMVARTREVVERPTAPPPLDADPRCGRCSHAGICLPEERRQDVVLRQIRVSDPTGECLYLTVPGSRASLDHGRIKVVHQDETLTSLPINRVNSVVILDSAPWSGGVWGDGTAP